MLGESASVFGATLSDNASGAENQQERFSIGSISPDIGHFLSELMSAGLNDSTYVEVLQIRERMNGGGKRRHTMEKILRDYTPNSEPSRAQG